MIIKDYKYKNSIDGIHFRAWHKTWEEMGWIACIR